MGDLSVHFSTKEFACHCGCGLSRPSPVLIKALEQVRSAVGVPIKVLSGSRCEAHNREVGGKAHSFHLVQGSPKGNGLGFSLAADIQAKGLTLNDLYLVVSIVHEFAGGGIGVYYGHGSYFMHVDVRPKAARWGELDGEPEPLIAVLHASKQEVQT
jgi:uncharacterized protein YcbK (DUF882 family)